MCIFIAILGRGRGSLGDSNLVWSFGGQLTEGKESWEVMGVVVIEEFGFDQYEVMVFEIEAGVRGEWELMSEYT